MSARILVLGAAGRLGQKAAEAFRDAGWIVTSLVRPGGAARAPADTEVLEINALDHAAIGKAARGADVVLHALNPPYTDWSRLALPLAYSAVAAAETAGATLLFPGNLYNYGSPLPPIIDENAPMRPSSRKGQLRVAIEDRMMEAAERGVRTIVLRAGDFYGGGAGSWFDLVLVKEIGRGRITYPGPLEVAHEWAYLPDVAAALLRLASVREALPRFASFGFPGHAITGRELTAAIARAMPGSSLEIKRMTWWLIHALRPIVPLCRELSEIAYLWNEPHRINGSKLKAAIGNIPCTPLDLAVARALEDLRAIA
ncbi:MAG TPA: NAD-dependent epimerase/dehydratase family protein [Xanthobacteraceae bacterium]|nr:NAD-dependent epimerase/dehydratase family protein [Xanthobacteraceae bacterium]